MNATWGTECQRYFIQIGELNSKGNPKTMAVDVRKMHIKGKFIGTEYYRVSLIKRNKQRVYSVKQRVAPNRAWWDKSPIKESDYKWVKEGTYTREQFLKWLGYFVERPEAATVELETCPPDNLAA